MSIIKIKYKDAKYGGDPDKYYYISDTEYEENKMILCEDSKETKEKGQANIMDIINSGKAPGVVSSNKTPSLMHNHKLDEGAVGNLLDVGLDGAKNRALARNKKIGSSFRHIKNRHRKNRRKH